MGLLTENNAHYYSGQQVYVEKEATGSFVQIPWAGNVPLIGISLAGSGTNPNYRVTRNGVEMTFGYTLSEGRVIVSTTTLGDVIIIELHTYAIESNYGSYAYITVDDIVNNFQVAYVGEDKLIAKVKRTDILFHAKRGLQEFSYDTLNSIKSQELTVPLNLGIPLPQDFVNLVSVSVIDENGLKQPIYPNSLTKSPTELPIQDSSGIPVQDDKGNNVDASSSIVEDSFRDFNLERVSGRDSQRGGRYGLDPVTSHTNGLYLLNKREGKISFSSGLVDRPIVLEYLSDGLAYDEDTKVPKMAEEAMYAHILYSILANRSRQPEYIVSRLKRERSAKLRNAKIRLSNIKLSEIIQVMRGKSKQIKH
tara:strand:+ start:281 stop:1372 length:1092 start_codon:yes stop_codon:yes gene_type:complete